MSESYNCSISSSIIGIVSPFSFSYSVLFVGVNYYGINFHFLDDKLNLVPFVCLSVSSISFLNGLQTFCLLFIVLLVFFYVFVRFQYTIWIRGCYMHCKYLFSFCNLLFYILLVFLVKKTV